MKKFIFVCAECGSESIQATAWYDVNTNEIVSGDPPTDQVYCLDCDEETSIVEKANFEESN
jgi:hypothetical protein